MALELVPFNPAWLSHESLDIHAIYKRPKRRKWTGELQRDDYGFILYDLTGPLPVRQHASHVRKGFVYVTLASPQDLEALCRPGVEKGGVDRMSRTDADRYRSQEYQRGPWVCETYMSDLEVEKNERIGRVQANIAEHGPDYAELYEKQHDPNYVLPQHLRTPPAPVEPPTPAPKKRGRPRKVKPEEPKPEAVTA